MSTWRIERIIPDIIALKNLLSGAHAGLGRKPGEAMAVRARPRGLVLARLPAAAEQPRGAHRIRAAPRRPRGLVPARAPRRRPAQPAHAASGGVPRAGAG